MAGTIKKIFTTREIRKRLLFTALIIVLIRIGCQIPIPGADSQVINNLLGGLTSGVFGLINAFTGSSLSNFSIFSLNVTTYITASIIIQLLTIAFPKLEEMARDGETGKQKMNRITRYVTVGLALVESTAMCIGFGRQGIFGSMAGFSYVSAIITAVCMMTAGAMVVVWMGDMITERGIGNGISIILLTNIISTMPRDYIALFQQFVFGPANVGRGIAGAFIIILVTIGVIAFVVYLNAGVRQVPVQYSGKITGGKSYGGRPSNIPLKVNISGVIPIIFAASLFQMPGMICGFINNQILPEWVKYFTTSYWFNPHSMQYTAGLALYIALIIFFAYFYTQITFNPVQVADNLKKSGGAIPGIRPGAPTAQYLQSILKPLVLIGAIALCIISIIPMVISGVFNAQLSFAGTSLIIVVSVITETAEKIDSMLVTRHYNGFLSKADPKAALTGSRRTIFN